MADSGNGGDFHLTQQELDDEASFEQAVEPRTRRQGVVHHGGQFWFAVLAVVAVVIVGLIVLYPRKTPCHEQIIFEPTAAPRAKTDRKSVV